MYREKISYNKPSRYTNFSNLFRKEFLHVSDSSSVRHQKFFHCTHNNGICHTGLLTACKQDLDGKEFHPDHVRKLSANLCDIYHCCVYNEKTPDDGQRNCPKHVEIPSEINLRN